MKRSDVRKDITGRRFGRLQVLWPAGKDRNRGYSWIAQCDDGTVICVRGVMLRTGKTRSCGCLQREAAPRNAIRKHNQSGTAEYQAYFDAERRCNNPEYHAYPQYGGRGIKFLLTGFPQFIAALGRKPEGCVLDRIDNDGHYELGNLRWATMSQSNLNRRMPWAKKVAV